MSARGHRFVTQPLSPMYRDHGPLTRFWRRIRRATGTEVR